MAVARARAVARAAPRRPCGAPAAMQQAQLRPCLSSLSIAFCRKACLLRVPYATRMPSTATSAARAQLERNM